MENNEYSEILSHSVDEKVQKLIKEVISYFPDKKLLVHPISLAKEELRETINMNVNGISKPSLNKYIGIWINESLSTNEFNIILAEELYHHIQAYYEYPAIFGYNDNDFFVTFRNLLNTTIWDIDAHHHLINREFNLTPIQNLDYKEAIESIELLSQVQLYQFSQPSQNPIFFPQYLLWWYDLAYLSSPLKGQWETEINQWFLKHIPLQTQEKWSSLLQFIKENQISSSYSAKTSMTEICSVLIKRMPIFVSAHIKGLDIKLILKELVPHTQT